ncbi:hypothetical protein RHS01_05970 [Rhizoctonia solani]|uniref:Uncharacterized protein n=1 Tax=Rhizoctonia solani TaxID=456999 RepID=A0A8H7IDI9_9AGAM|nr:hypothetical protein RHS01_05970 [Rhizoctonia solani]
MVQYPWFKRFLISNRDHVPPKESSRFEYHPFRKIYVYSSWMQETERLAADPAPGISASPHEDNLRYFDVTIAGPGGSPFEGGAFKLELFLPEEYPMSPPKVRFLTKIYHPNIDKLGRICLDILKDKWSPALQIRTVLLSIQALLSAPNPDDPLATDVAKHYKENESDAIRVSKEWTENVFCNLAVCAGTPIGLWALISEIGTEGPTMSGSTAAQLYTYVPGTSTHTFSMNYSSSDNSTYLTSSVGAGPSTQPSTNPNGENTPGSTKRPFPWASSESQERDKRPRSGSGNGNAATSAIPDDLEETMSTDESAYASAAESPNPNFSRSPTRPDWPLSTVDDPETRAPAVAPRIPTPAALRSSSPLHLPNFAPLRLALPPRSTSTNNVASSEPRAQPLDLGWLTQQLDEALPPPRDRAFSLSFGSASVDSALPLPQHSRAGSTRVPLPWVDIEGESVGSSLLATSESVSASLEPGSGSGSLGPSSIARSATSSPGAASTVRSDHSPRTIAPANHSPPAVTATRRPLSLNLLNFPLAPGPDSPSTAFPTSASPRTSAFDLAVTPPGSALPSFVARMMEVDSPVHSGGDSYISSQAELYTPSADRTESYVPSPSQTGTFVPSEPQMPYGPPLPQTESYPSSPQLDGGDASLDALRRFMRQEGTARTGLVHQESSELMEHQGTGLLRQSERGNSSSVSPNQAQAGMAVGSYFPPVETDERQPHAGEVLRGVPLSTSGHEQQHHLEQTPPEHLPQIGPEQLSSYTHTEEVPRNGHNEQAISNNPSKRRFDLRIDLLAPPEPGRMSWSDLFGPRTPETGGSEVAMGTRGSEISTGTRGSETTTALRSSEATMGTASTRETDIGMGTRRPVDIATTTSRAQLGSTSTPYLLKMHKRYEFESHTTGIGQPHYNVVRGQCLSSTANIERSVDGSIPRTGLLHPSLSSRDRPTEPECLLRSPQATPDPSPTYDATSTLARYQTFAQSIDEIRRSPPLQQSAPPEPSWGGSGSNRSSWAFPRHEPPQYHPSPPTDGNWLREWESQRDRRSRAAREDYIRRRDSDYSHNDRRHDTGYTGNEEVPRRPPMAQLSDTQAQGQGQVWPDFVARSRPHPRPMTRASLVATGFADSDLWPENDESNTRLWGEIPRPARRPEVLPARSNDIAAPMQFLPGNHEGGMVFTESASHVLRASLVDTSRRASDGPTRPLPPAESERVRVSSRERWESHLTRSQVQLERVRQLLHRSHDPRERDTSRRHPPESPTYHPHRRSFLSPLDNENPPSNMSSDSRRSSVSAVAWPHPGATEAPPPRPFTMHEGDRPEWPSSDTPTRNNTLTHELMRASSLRGRRRRTLLPESASRRDSTGFMHSVNNALNQVESGLLELSALANEGNDHTHHYGPQHEPGPTRPHSPSHSGHTGWVYEPTERNPTPPPTLPPFEFSSAQRTSGWPAERYIHPAGGSSGLGSELPLEYPSRRTPTRGLDGYLEQRQSARDSSSTRGTRASSYANEGSWRSNGPSNEWWSNDVPPPSLPSHMPLRDRLLFRPSGGSHQSVASSRQAESGNNRNSNMGSSIQTQSPSATFGRLHRRRLSPPAPPHQPSVSSSLLRPFANQNNSTSPTRSYSRFSHFLPRRNSGRGGGGSSDDNDEWHHAEQATRRFFLRSRGRTRPQPPSGDYLRDDEFDDSYEGLLRLAARIGDAKPRGTPAEVIRSMLSCRYGDSPEARAEARCPICLDDYSSEDVVTVVKRCSHWFHRECVQQWLSNSRTCPVCRGQADGEESEPQAGPSTRASDNSWV